MKNLQKGFVVPLVIAVIVLLVAGGIYLYKTKSNSGLIVKNETVNSKTYTNTTYGFKFEYPITHESFVLSDNVNRNNISSLSTELARKIGDSEGYSGRKGETLLVNVFKLDTYRFQQGSAGVEYGYDLTTNTWWKKTSSSGEVLFEPSTVKIANTLGYKFAEGDAGYRTEVVVIPNKQKNIIIEIGMLEGPNTQVTVSLDKMAETFKFTN